MKDAIACDAMGRLQLYRIFTMVERISGTACLIVLLGTVFTGIRCGLQSTGTVTVLPPANLAKISDIGINKQNMTP
jgi:hypothetical protein